MWDLNFGTWISHRGFTVAFGHEHPLVKSKMKWAANLTKDFFRIPLTKFRHILRKNCQKLPHLEIAFIMEIRGDL
jgi:hypothetical protein